MLLFFMTGSGRAGNLYWGGAEDGLVGGKRWKPWRTSWWWRCSESVSASERFRGPVFEEGSEGGHVADAVAEVDAEGQAAAVEEVGLHGKQGTFHGRRLGGREPARDELGQSLCLECVSHLAIGILLSTRRTRLLGRCSRPDNRQPSGQGVESDEAPRERGLEEGGRRDGVVGRVEEDEMNEDGGGGQAQGGKMGKTKVRRPV